MEEYRKIANVTKKIESDAPHNVILVLDATSGQNVINQVEEFNKIIPITGIVMTKLMERKRWYSFSISKKI